METTFVTYDAEKMAAEQRDLEFRKAMQVAMDRLGEENRRLRSLLQAIGVLASAEEQVR